MRQGGSTPPRAKAMSFHCEVEAALCDVRVDGQHPPDHRVGSGIQVRQGYPQEERIGVVDTAVLAIDLFPRSALNPDAAVRGLELLGEIEPDLLGRARDGVLARGLGPLKPAVGMCDAGSGKRDGKREENCPRAASDQIADPISVSQFQRPSCSSRSLRWSAANRGHRPRRRPTRHP